MRTVVVLPENLMRRCRAFGPQSCDGYRKGLKSTALSMDGAELNPALQTMGRVAECAVCLWAKLDPLSALDWSAQPDAGFDLVLQDYRFDIKSSSNGAQYLIWPLSKNAEFATRQFDLLGFVRVGGARCELVGWTHKDTFRIHHDIASDGHKLKPGTWFMHASQLYPFDREGWGIG